MPRIVTMLLVTGLVLVLSSGKELAADEPLTAQQLYRACNAFDGVSQIQCAAYIGGALDVYRNTENAGSQADPGPICAPFLPPRKRQEIFLAWSKTNKDKIKALSAFEVVRVVFSTKFPCSLP